MQCYPRLGHCCDSGLGHNVGAGEIDGSTLATTIRIHSEKLLLSSPQRSSSFVDKGASDEGATEEEATSVGYSRGIGMTKFTAAARESIDAVSAIHKRSKRI
ncbi:hypothetical protein ZIOFF_009885 [Zingiber officinale]|uniref:Uncharacterized protein n=1 Tax=Zingiber officinale TaxID=94328 RepID=A0A8J5HIF4_ZINOF|nr:hypothetical protein ZIOFF_009885 [Zingiber officinale]